MLSLLPDDIRIGGIGADDVFGSGAGGPPTVEHTFGGETGEDADHRDSESGGGVATGRIVAGVQLAARDLGGETGEGTVPSFDVRAGGAGGFDGALDTRGFFPARAFVDEDGAAEGEGAEEIGFEGAADALGGIFADAEADGDGSGRRLDGGRSYERASAGDAEGLFGPSGGEGAERLGAIATEGAAFEEEIILFEADGQQAELGEAGIGIDDDGSGGGAGGGERDVDGEALGESAALVGDGE